ncbi:unnamed protein product [Rotaria sp. Silwood1]|nr:unnamed protein product [Rotaria sp. Silwood1]CAF0740135.1 unnamed protein product [Rotaria sp. Silwood1]CAF3335102.1 unnamed protein product [Rotaria sp. Silwood1]CAF3354593.1 unnamed protein product [Rotaria sp. Silwood1]CAF4573934.1 unnamed protein product [Rotaria sp. Silwood1]
MRVVIVLFLLCIVVSNAIRCYMGSGTQCMVGPDMKQCGEQGECVCAKYKFLCTGNDQGCTLEEQQKRTTKWAYTIIASKMCNQMRKTPFIYKKLLCCKKDKCNRPGKGTTCAAIPMNMFNQQ